MTSEPTQEELDEARVVARQSFDNTFASASESGRGWPKEAHLHQIVAFGRAKAAPLREEIERLIEENKGFHEVVADLNLQFLPLEQRADAAEAKVLSLEAEIERLKAPRMFPLQTELRSTKYPKQQFTRIPWAIAERAYATYSARYGKDQSLERLAERGGFGQQEMDDFYPPWRDELAFPAQILALEKQLFEEHLKGEACTLDWAEKLDAALAAASRAREEQGALRAAALETMQERVERWVRLAFHEGALTDRWERIARVVEEVIELAQAEGMTCDEVIKSAAWVFNRPSGDVNQEVGGVMVTLLAWAAGRKTSLSECALREIERIEQPATIEKIRRKQAEKAAAGTGHNFAALAPPAAESQENQQQLTGKKWAK